MELFRLLGTIAIDNSGANNAIDDTTDKAEKSESRMAAAFKKIGTAVATAFAVDKIVDFGKVCVETAASVKAANSQFEQTFGELQNQATAAIDRVAESSNILDTRLRGVGTSIFAFAKTTGMESADALGMMERALKVTADSAAYYDRSLEETSESLKSFLKGNYENDSALGLSCTEVTRNTAAMKLYGKEFKELSESQKQLTLLRMVEEANELSGALDQASREGTGWENVTGNMKEAWKQFQAVIGAPILQRLVPVVMNVTDKIMELTSSLGEKLEPAFLKFDDVTSDIGEFWREVLQPAIEEVGTALGNVWNALQPVFDIFSNLLPPVEPFDLFRQACWLVEDALEWVAAKLNIFSDWITNNQSLFAGAADLIGNAFSVFKEICQEAHDAYYGIMQPIWDAMNYAVGLLADYFAEKMPEIQAFVQEAVVGIQDTWENHLKPAFEAIGNFLNTYLKPAFEFVFETIIKPLVDNTFGFIVRLWNGTLKPVLQGIGDFLTGVFTGDWDKALNGIGKIADGILTGIASAFMSCMDLARDAVTNGINFIKNKFNFSWSLPDLKMPHFWVSGDFSLNPLSVPSFGIDWYAKAMDDPMIMDSPTAFGINSLGQLMAGGEAGSEVVSGTDTLMNMISEAVAAKNARLEELLAKLLAFIMEYLPQIANMKLVTDTGALIGELAPGMDEALGILSDRNRRSG